MYDLDLIQDPRTGAFNEVYLYEELMEADLHAIVRPTDCSHFSVHTRADSAFLTSA